MTTRPASTPGADISRGKRLAFMAIVIALSLVLLE
jgi:hypothetical protein